MNIQELVAQSVKDRYALIVTEENEEFADQHLGEIYQEYPCTGVLVMQSTSGVAYHVTTVGPDIILAEGLKANDDEEAGTYGGGVIYTYPSLDCYTGLNSSFHVFAVHYGPGTLRAIATYDKDEKEQGEICIPPECITEVEYIGTGDHCVDS